jgi:hypothetical protein
MPQKGRLRIEELNAADMTEPVLHYVPDLRTDVILFVAELYQEIDDIMLMVVHVRAELKPACADVLNENQVLSESTFV